MLPLATNYHDQSDQGPLLTHKYLTIVLCWLTISELKGTNCAKIQAIYYILGPIKIERENS